MKILGIITARGGSKRLPRKNIKEFLGKPLLAWVTQAGLKSGVLDRFILTTDDEEIAKIGKKYDIKYLSLGQRNLHRINHLLMVW